MKNRELEASILRFFAFARFGSRVISIAIERRLPRTARAKRGRLIRTGAIADRAVAIEVKDRRSDDEILGYDERGIYR